MNATRTKTQKQKVGKSSKNVGKICMEIHFSIQVAAGNSGGNGINDNNSNNNTQTETTSSVTKITTALV